MRAFAQLYPLANRTVAHHRQVNSMSAFERLLVPGCTELLACRCGKEMQIASLDQLPGRSYAYVRVYNCPACHHERRLTVWATDAVAQKPPQLVGGLRSSSVLS